MEPVDVPELLADVSTSFSGQVDAAGVKMKVAVPADGVGLTVQGDPARLDQVISNLVANALRYTPRGGEIILAAEPVKDSLQITVKDNGAGIPMEDQPYIFDRFWKGDRSRSRAGGAGSGLGLAISRNLVLAHGGDIRVESELGAGTTFIIAIPKS
jgi:signal transduction histidine kinase